MVQTAPGSARERILDAADELFSQRGYTAVRLRDIAARVGIRHASLYHHVPGGKEALFVEVMERNLRRHHAGLTSAVRGAGGGVREKLRAIAAWLASQPPLDLQRMVHADMPELSADDAARLMGLAFRLLGGPIAEVVRDAGAELAIADPEFAAMSFLSLVQGVHAIPAVHLVEPREAYARRAADMLLDGWAAR